MDACSAVFALNMRICMYMHAYLAYCMMYLWETKMFSVPQNGEIQIYITFLNDENYITEKMIPISSCQ